MSDPTKEAAADKAVFDAKCQRTLAMLRKPSEEEQAKQDALAKAAKNHHNMAVCQWPETRLQLAKSQKYGTPGSTQDVQYAPLFTESLEALGPIVAEFGLAAFDGEVQAMSLELINAARHALQFYPGNMPVTLAAGFLIKALSDRNILQNETDLTLKCKKALMLNVEDLGVQKLYRNVLLHFGHRCLDPIAKVQMEKQMQTTLILMTPSVGGGKERVPTTLQDVLQCLAKLVKYGQFVLMCDDEHFEFKTQVAVFAAWCLAGCIRESENACFFGNLVVGRQACVLLYQMAAGCMQENATYLVEEHRQSLCDLDIPKQMVELRQRLHARDGLPADARMGWLIVRLGRTPLHRAMDGSGPGPVGAPAAKRRRGEGGSA